jgi:hypothetical protein
MTPKEKAEELVNKMHSQMPVKIIPIASTRENQLSCNIDLKGNLKNAMQCALIAVDEVQNTKAVYANDVEYDYWEQVKNEINLL